MASVTKGESKKNLDQINDLIAKLNAEATRRNLSPGYQVPSIPAEKGKLDYDTFKKINNTRVAIGNVNRYCSTETNITCGTVGNGKPSSNYDGRDFTSTAAVSGEQKLNRFKRGYASQYNALLNDVESLAKMCPCNSVKSTCSTDTSCGCHNQCSCENQTTCKCDDVCTCNGNTTCKCDDVFTCKETSCGCNSYGYYPGCCEDNYVCDCDWVRYCDCNSVAYEYLYDGMTESELEDFFDSNGIDWSDFFLFCGVCTECVETDEYERCDCFEEEYDCECNSDYATCRCVSEPCSTNCNCNKVCQCEREAACTCNQVCDCESVSSGCQCNTVSDNPNACMADCLCNKVCVEYSTNLPGGSHGGGSND